MRKTPGPRGYAAIGLSSPKTHANVGAVLRAAGCFGAALVVATGRRWQRSATDASNAYLDLPLVHCTDLRDAMPFDCVPVAVELTENSIPLPEYEHPDRAFYIFGPEDGDLGAKTLSWCRDVVQIPTIGCLNLAASVNIVLYDRLMKRMR
ncbi:MAG: TrmH family RNA methyltransferase [Planctomycetaceae bacterium]|nr:TrmH family RNA methyltransferase [Planctomycetaceae bacterium]